jgi:hypothetical protein
MEITFKIIAVILAGVAAYFLLEGNGDRAFVSAVLGAVSFFWSVRLQVKARNDERERERLEAEKRAEDEFEEDFEEDFEDEFEDDEEYSNTETPRLTDAPAREQIGSEQRKTDNEPRI